VVSQVCWTHVTLTMVIFYGIPQILQVNTDTVCKGATLLPTHS